MNSIPGKAETKYLENIRDSREKALLIFIKNRKNRINFDQNVKELQNLALSAGADVEDTVIHSQDEPNPKYYISTGKLEQIKGTVEAKGNRAGNN
ncbi:MAG: hypothetical protein U5N58_09040 [Actinomycetota bacterium]|nr:hypothetical protein [Actinomycetota bacterium]